MPKIERITLAYGGGGRKTAELVDGLILPLLGGRAVPPRNDSEPLPSHHALLMTTDGYTVKPPFFPGGDIGRLSVIGTANDLAVAGACPKWLALSAIIEEGTPVEDVKRVFRSVGQALEETGFTLLAGDTKTVEKGAGDGIYLATTGIGELFVQPRPTLDAIKPGDEVVISGPLGRHGAAILAARMGLKTHSLVSDLAVLLPLMQSAQDAGIPIHYARDLTRGGLAAAVNDLAKASHTTFRIHETSVPADPAVDAVLNILGILSYDVACEGTMIAVVSQGTAQMLIDAWKALPVGREAALIGEVLAAGDFPALLVTSLGQERLLEAPYGENLPRIC